MTLQYTTDALLAPFLRGETEARSSWVPCQGHTARKWQSGQRPSTLAGAQAVAGPWLGGIAELASFSEQREDTARPTRARREAWHCSLRARHKDTHCQPEKLGATICATEAESPRGKGVGTTRPDTHSQALISGWGRRSLGGEGPAATTRAWSADAADLR